MKKLTYQFSDKITQYYLGDSIDNLHEYVSPDRVVIIMDENVERLHGSKLSAWKKLVVTSGEAAKEINVFTELIEGLTKLEADRKTMLIGIGGGVVTDLTGFAASVYMRGAPFAFVPTTLLAQVDASIGGKNGINFRQYKNMLGTIRQPEFILFDYQLLSTLPEEEWISGLAEVIKYGCIMDADLFHYLEENRIAILNREQQAVSLLIGKCVKHKSDIVKADEFEMNQRRWLNFGHTIGHPVEKLEKIAHGKAVSIGMVAAAKLSEKMVHLDNKSTARLIRLLNDYHLPVIITCSREEIYNLFKLDKKREKDFIHFVLLEQLGKAVIKPVLLDDLKTMLFEL
jgi:3-dehydroquinate synthase